MALRYIIPIVLLLSGCATMSAIQHGEPIAPALQKDVDAGQFVCDINAALTVTDLEIAGVSDAAVRACAILEVFATTGTLLSAPGPQFNADAALLGQTDAVNTLGYQRLYRDKLVTLSRQAFTAFEAAVLGLFPTYQSIEDTFFSSLRTDSKACGKGSITAISFCHDEAFFTADQFRIYRTPVLAAIYTTGHEVAGHAVQQQKGMFTKWRGETAFLEKQADCLMMAVYQELKATPEENAAIMAERFAIGDLVTHGTAASAVAFMEYGIDKGFEACLLLTPSDKLI